jgi:hypothetical protein
MSLATRSAEPGIRTDGGRIIIDVNWAEADALREHFSRQGLKGTVSLDPTVHEATLELWDEPELDRVRNVLAAWTK